jgi:hypothetical protein
MFAHHICWAYSYLYSEPPTVFQFPFRNALSFIIFRHSSFSLFLLLIWSVILFTLVFSFHKDFFPLSSFYLAHVLIYTFCSTESNFLRTFYFRFTTGLLSNRLLISVISNVCFVPFYLYCLWIGRFVTESCWQ